jgi:hypothetical protein
MSQHPFERRSHSDARYRQDASSISGSSSFHRNFYRQDGSYQRHPSEGIPSSSQQPYDAFSVRNAPSHIGEAYNQRYEQSVQARTRSCLQTHNQSRMAAIMIIAWKLTARFS